MIKMISHCGNLVKEKFLNSHTVFHLLLIFSEYVFDFDIIELDLDDVEEDEGLDLKNRFHVKNLSGRKIHKVSHCVSFTLLNDFWQMKFQHSRTLLETQPLLYLLAMLQLWKIIIFTKNS